MSLCPGSLAYQKKPSHPAIKPEAHTATRTPHLGKAQTGYINVTGKLISCYTVSTMPGERLELPTPIRHTS